jgi:hypothetical protein
MRNARVVPKHTARPGAHLRVGDDQQAAVVLRKVLLQPHARLRDVTNTVTQRRSAHEASSSGTAERRTMNEDVASAGCYTGYQHCGVCQG